MLARGFRPAVAGRKKHRVDPVSDWLSYETPEYKSIDCCIGKILIINILRKFILAGAVGDV
jgi:hypothetical protein